MNTVLSFLSAQFQRLHIAIDNLFNSAINLVLQATNLGIRIMILFVLYKVAFQDLLGNILS